MVVSSTFKGLACVGVDQSIKGCGVAVVLDGKVTWAHGWTQVKKQQKQHPDFLSWFKPRSASDNNCKVNRLVQVSDWVLGVVRHLIASGYGVTVAMEGYALNQKSSRQSDLYELGGMIKAGMWKMGVPFRIYTPQEVKKAWTGSGNADKAMMKKACLDHFGADFFDLGDDGENLADAVLIAQLLQCEVNIRQGRHVPRQAKQVLTRTTPKNDVCLSQQPFIFYDADNHVAPITTGLKGIEDDN